MDYFNLKEKLKVFSETDGVQYVFSIHNLDGLIVDSFTSNEIDSEKAKEIEVRISVFSSEVLKIKALTNSLKFQGLKQQIYFFAEGDFLLIEEVEHLDMFIVVSGNSNALISEVRYKLRQVTS